MAINGITYGTSSVLNQSVLNLKNQMTTLQSQLTTGEKSTTYAGMGVNEGFAIFARAQLSNLDAFSSTITNVNTTINKLRQVLGDSSDNPTYIETIPRRGYSFMATVEYSDVRDVPPMEVETNDEGATQSDAPQTAWSKKQISTLLRVMSLLFAGIVLGALLAFIWFFAQAKNQRAVNNLKVSAALTMQDGAGATKPAAHLS